MKKVGTMLVSVLAAVMLAASAGPASAEGSEVAYNQVGVRFFDEQKIQAGEMFTAPNGQQVPSGITYTDAAGGKTTYLSIRQLSELLDADIRWDSESGNVEIAGYPKNTNITVTVQNPSEESSEPENDAAQAREFGQVIGPFEEIDPKSIEDVIEKNPYPVTYMGDVHIQHDSIMQPVMMTATPGQYLVYTVTNNGTSDAVSSVYRQPVVAYPRRDYFPKVTVAPGETLVRAFKAAEDANPLTYGLFFSFMPVSGSEGPGPADMTVSLVEYPVNQAG